MLENKVVIVTGGSSGIGKAAAENFVEEGCEVVISSYDEEVGEDASSEIGCEFVACDVRSYREVEEMVDSVADKYGGLDVMVNNAGIARQNKLEDTTREEWSNVVETNLTGVMYGCQASLPYLKPGVR